MVVQQQTTTNPEHAFLFRLGEIERRVVVGLGFEDFGQALQQCWSISELRTYCRRRFGV